MRIVVATDRSSTAEAAVAWGAQLAEHEQAELVLLQIAPASGNGDAVGLADARGVATARCAPLASVTPPPSATSERSWYEARLCATGSDGCWPS